MSVDKLVDSTQLNSDLTSVANAIRTKGGTSAQLAFPSDFVSAIGAISSGGLNWPIGHVYKVTPATESNILTVTLTEDYTPTYVAVMMTDPVTPAGTGNIHILGLVSTINYTQTNAHITGEITLNVNPTGRVVRESTIAYYSSWGNMTATNSSLTVTWSREVSGYTCTFAAGVEYSILVLPSPWTFTVTTPDGLTIQPVEPPDLVDM